MNARVGGKHEESRHARSDAGTPSSPTSVGGHRFGPAVDATCAPTASLAHAARFGVPRAGGERCSRDGPQTGRLLLHHVEILKGGHHGPTQGRLQLKLERQIGRAFLRCPQTDGHRRPTRTRSVTEHLAAPGLW